PPRVGAPKWPLHPQARSGHPGDPRRPSTPADPVWSPGADAVKPRGPPIGEGGTRENAAEPAARERTLLHGAGGEAGDVVVEEEDVEDHDRHHAQHGAAA